MIGLISDTHGLLREEVVYNLSNCNLIIHTGDIGKFEVIENLEKIAKVEFIRGNCDKDKNIAKEDKIIDVYNIRIYLVHDISKVSIDLKEENIDILKIYFCPHNEKDHCHCKKPKPGMIEQAKKDFLIDMNNSIYIGDSQVDYLLAKHFTLTFYGINYNGDNVKSYRSILEISKQIKKIQNK